MKKSNIAIFPGTFDPMTNGHLDIIARAAKLFDKLIIAIADNIGKMPLFSLEERISLMQNATQNYPHIVVKGCSILMAQFAKDECANILIRGVRTIKDFEYEHQLATLNRQLNPHLETVLLFSDEKYAALSSSIIKEIAKFKGDVSAFVDENTHNALLKKFKQIR